MSEAKSIFPRRARARTQTHSVSPVRHYTHTHTHLLPPPRLCTLRTRSLIHTHANVYIIYINITCARVVFQYLLSRSTARGMSLALRRRWRRQQQSAHANVQCDRPQVRVPHTFARVCVCARARVSLLCSAV